MSSTNTMNDDLLDNYNPLYDVHLRQYFALPHMQRHLRHIGLLEDTGQGAASSCDEEMYVRHHVMIDKMLRNREAELQKYADLQRKLDAAEKIEICRRIRSGATSPSIWHRAKPSRSLSRGRFMKTHRRRRSSTSTDDKDLIKKIEAANEEPVYENPSLLDDETLATYMEQLRRQLSRLERFREVSFGPYSVARHQSDPHVSWFFRRRSLPSLTDTTPTTTITTTTTTAHTNMHEQPTLRSAQSLKQQRLSRSGKSQSPRKAMQGDSHDGRPQPKRRRSTENSSKLPPIARNVESGPMSTAAISITKLPPAGRIPPTIAKRTVQESTTTTTTSTCRKPVRVQKARPKTEASTTLPELAVVGIPATISASKITPKSKKKVLAPGRASSLNVDEERGVTYGSYGTASTENMDFGRKGGSSDLPASSSEHPQTPPDVEMRSESELSGKTLEEKQIEEIKIGDQQHPELSSASPEEIFGKVETKVVSESKTPESPASLQRAEPEFEENLARYKIDLNDTISAETDYRQLVVPEVSVYPPSDRSITDEEGETDRSDTKAESESKGQLLDKVPAFDGGSNVEQPEDHESMVTEKPTEEAKKMNSAAVVMEFRESEGTILTPFTVVALEAQESKVPECEKSEKSALIMPTATTELPIAEETVTAHPEVAKCEEAIVNEINQTVKESDATDEESSKEFPQPTAAAAASETLLEPEHPEEFYHREAAVTVSEKYLEEKWSEENRVPEGARIEKSEDDALSNENLPPTDSFTEVRPSEKSGTVESHITISNKELGAPQVEEQILVLKRFTELQAEESPWTHYITVSGESGHEVPEETVSEEKRGTEASAVGSDFAEKTEIEQQTHLTTEEVPDSLETVRESLLETVVTEEKASATPEVLGHSPEPKIAFVECTQEVSPNRAAASVANERSEVPEPAEAASNVFPTAELESVPEYSVKQSKPIFADEQQEALSGSHVDDTQTTVELGTETLLEPGEPEFRKKLNEPPGTVPIDKSGKKAPQEEAGNANTERTTVVAEEIHEKSEVSESTASVEVSQKQRTEPEVIAKNEDSASTEQHPEPETKKGETKSPETILVEDMEEQKTAPENNVAGAGLPYNTLERALVDEAGAPEDAGKEADFEGKELKQPEEMHTQMENGMVQEARPAPEAEQPRIDTHLKSNEEFETKMKPESVAVMPDVIAQEASLPGDSSKTEDKPLNVDMDVAVELQRKEREESGVKLEVEQAAAMLGASQLENFSFEISEAKAGSEAVPLSDEISKLASTPQAGMESTTAAFTDNDMQIPAPVEQVAKSLQCIEQPANLPIGETAGSSPEAEIKADKTATERRAEFFETTGVSPENAVIERLTGNHEFVISGIEILEHPVSLEEVKQTLDSELSTEVPSMCYKETVFKDMTQEDLQPEEQKYPGTVTVSHETVVTGTELSDSSNMYAVQEQEGLLKGGEDLEFTEESKTSHEEQKPAYQEEGAVKEVSEDDDQEKQNIPESQTIEEQIVKSTLMKAESAPPEVAEGSSALTEHKFISATMTKSDDHLKTEESGAQEESSPQGERGEVEMGKKVDYRNAPFEAEFVSQEQISQDLEYLPMRSHDTSEETVIAGTSEYVEVIQEIVVKPDIETMEVQEHNPAAAEEIVGQESSPEEIGAAKQPKLSETKVIDYERKTDKVTSQTVGDKVNEFLEQYLRELIQSVVQQANETLKPVEAPEEIAEKAELLKPDEGQLEFYPKKHSSSSTEFPVPPLGSGPAASEFAVMPKTLVESSQSQSTVPNSEHPDNSTEVSESAAIEQCQIIRSLPSENAESIQQAKEIANHAQNLLEEPYEQELKQVGPPEREQNIYIVESAGQNEQIRNSVEKSWKKTPESVKVKSVPEAVASSNGSTSEVPEETPQHLWIIDGLTAEGISILGSVNDSETLSENKLRNKFAHSGGTTEVLDNGITSTSGDNNGNPERNEDSSNISSYTTEPEIDGPDENANVSTPQDSGKHLEMEQHSTMDEHLLLEQSNSVAGREDEANNVDGGQPISRKDQLQRTI